MPSLRELQQAFADAVMAGDGAAPAFALASGVPGAERIAIYRNTILSNYRNALAATYPVVKRLVGASFFNTAVDAYVQVQPSACGDLNVYGDRFGDFLAAYPHAAHLPWLADIARVEWAIDEAQRAADAARDPHAVLAALAATAPERLPHLRLRLDASCRLLASDYPVLHIWQVNQPGHDGDDRVDLGEGGDRLVVRRDANGVTIARVDAGDYAFLAALAAGEALGAAIDAAQRVEAGFDFGAALHAALAAGTIAAAHEIAAPAMLGGPDSR